MSGKLRVSLGIALAAALAAYMVIGAVMLADTHQPTGTVTMQAVVIQAALGLTGGAVAITSFVAGVASILRSAAGSAVACVRCHRRSLAIAALLAGGWTFYVFAAYAS